MAQQLFIDGNNFSDLAGFHDEVERNLTKDLDWKIGRNLDAYNDILRGGFNVFEYEEPITLTWRNAEKSRRDLGYAATVVHFERMLTTCHPDNIPYVRDELAKAKQGEGQTLFDILVEITCEHEHITLVLA